MRVILLDSIVNLGKLGDQVNVKAGYARNFLVPKGKAVLATKKNIEYFNARQTEFKANLAKALATANERAEMISALGVINISSKVGEEGKLYGSVGPRDIADAITAAGVEVVKREVRLPCGVLRTSGEHKVGLQLHSEVFIEITIHVIPE